MLKSYNQKIIETPTYIEIWEYEKPVIYKIDERKLLNTNMNPLTGSKI